VAGRALSTAGEVGPPRPVRRSKSGNSGEWVTEPAGDRARPATRPARV